MNLSLFLDANKLHQATIDFFTQQLLIPIAPFDSKPIATATFFASNTDAQKQQLLQAIDKLYIVGLVNDAVLDGADSDVTTIADLEKQTTDYEGLLICAITIKAAPTRSLLSNITRMVNRKFPYLPVTILFRYDDAHICLANAQRIEYKVTHLQGEKIGKVIMLKDVNINNTHGAHLKILNDLQKPIAANTYQALYTHWQKIFNTKELNKQFFKKIANWYFWSVAKSKFPYEYLKANEKYANKTNAELQELANQKASIRFITRMVFVWFLKEKKLVPNQLFDTDFLKQTLKTFNTSTSSSYYNAILQNLFFATLNRDAKNRDFAQDEGYKINSAKNFDINSLYRYEKLFTDPAPKKIMKLFADIPFLNGGLFDSLDNKEAKEIVDGFSRKKEWQAVMPDYLFFENEEVDFSDELKIIYDKKGKYPVKGLFAIFNEYKFTVEENTPLDVDVALDPYLLGEIFENLLAYYNPETGSTARKGTGSFYTPQEIVNYMVSQSLQSYLQTQLPNIGIDNIDALPTLDATNKYNFVKALAQIKILDPACGSGAFPMGVLYKMVSLLQTIDADNKIWKQVQHDITLDTQIAKLKKDEQIVKGLNDKQVKAKATQAIATQLQELETNFDKQYNGSDFARKLYIIQNCIYGVDIQDVAVQISKLRFFLSLIVDQHNANIQPLPNLETKFVIANTLIGIEMPKPKDLYENDNSQDDLLALKLKLKAIRKLHFTAKNRQEKKALQKQDKDTRQQIIDSLLGLGKNEYKAQEIKRLQAVIANQTKALAKTQTDMPDMLQQHVVKDMFGGQTLHNRNLKQEAIADHKAKISDATTKLAKLTQNTLADTYKTQATKIANWDIYNQNASADWFDMDWMFGIEDGFDVVIGNPPYVQLQKDGGKLAKLYENQNYYTFGRTGDIYSLFYEKGIGILKQNGLLTFITSNSWMSTEYGEKTRKLFTNYNPLLILTFEGNQIFENAIVDSNILLIQKKVNQNQTIGININQLDSSLAELIEREKVELNHLNHTEWFIGSKEEINIKEKVENIGKPLGKWNVNINRGITTGFNDAFFIDDEKMNSLVIKNKEYSEIIKPLLRGRSLNRYHTEIKDSNIIFISWHFPLHKDKSINGASVNAEKIFKKKYHEIYSHLEIYKQQLSNRNKPETGIRYEWYAMQRCAANYIDDFSKPKIFWIQLSDKNRFTYSEDEIFATNSCFMMTANDSETSLKYLLAVLNSKLILTYYKMIGSKSGMGTLEWTGVGTQKIPIPKTISKNTKLSFETLVNQILTLKKSNADTTALEHQIDVMVYHLYGLTYAEACIIDATLSQADWEKYKIE